MRRMSSSRAWRFVVPRRRQMRSHAAIVSGEHRQFTGRAFGRRIVALEFMPGMVAAAGRTGYTPLGFSSFLFCDRRRVPTGGGYFDQTQTLDSARSDPAALPAGPRGHNRAGLAARPPYLVHVPASQAGSYAGRRRVRRRPFCHSQPGRSWRSGAPPRTSPGRGFIPCGPEVEGRAARGPRAVSALPMPLASGSPLLRSITSWRQNF